MNKSTFIEMLPLFLVIFIDAMGTALIIPLLSPLFIDMHISILPNNTSISMRTFLYGLTLGIYSIATFFGAPLLGDLSDQLGRKRIIMICLIGTFVGYVMSAIGIVLHSISLIIAGRVIDGFTAGSLSTAQAAIVDLSSEETKTKNIGYILFALSMGFMVGPLIGGFLSDPQWSSWFGLTTPLYFAGLLSFLNIILLQFGFKETFVPKMKKGISLISGFTVFRSAFSNSVIFRLTMAFLFLQLGWSTYVQFIGLFLTLEYHFNPHQVGVFMAFIGLGFTLAFCYLLNVLTHHFSLRMIALSTTGIMSASMLAVVLIKSEISAWILSVPAATCLALAYSVLVSLFSNAVDKEKQGWVMGLTGAIGALSFGLTGILAGVIVDYGTNIPIWIACICLGASCFSILFVPQKR